jgi:hypothetical protein
MSNIKVRLASATSVFAVAVAVVGISVAGGSTASAREPSETRSPAATAPANSVNSTSVVNESLTGADVKNGSLYQSDVNPAVVDVFRTPKAGSVWSSTLNNDIVTESKLAPSVRAKLNPVRPAFHSFDRTTIEKIGGPFAANATYVGEFEQPAGTWNVYTSVFFARTVAGATGTRPQIALRSPANADLNAGTILGTEISPTKDRELSATAVKHIVLDVPTTIAVYAFGYNDNASAAGGGEIDATVEVSVEPGK